MSSNDDARLYVVRALEGLGSICPERYTAMLKETPEYRVIANLRPWAFLLVPEDAVEYCSEALGRPVLPFAQAIGHDLMACFLTEPSTNPQVIVINPWSDNKADVFQQELPDYDAWLGYAEQVSYRLMALEMEEDEE